MAVDQFPVGQVQEILLGGRESRWIDVSDGRAEYVGVVTLMVNEKNTSRRIVTRKRWSCKEKVNRLTLGPEVA
jgi:hypothetical protein